MTLHFDSELGFQLPVHVQPVGRFSLVRVNDGGTLSSGLCCVEKEPSWEIVLHFFSLPEHVFLDSVVGLCLFSGFCAAISPTTEGKKYIRSTALAYVICFSHTATEV